MSKMVFGKTINRNSEIISPKEARKGLKPNLPVPSADRSEHFFVRSLKYGFLEKISEEIASGNFRLISENQIG